MSGYVWYSFGSDVTGKKLADALGYNSGKKLCALKQLQVLLSWGCKAGKKYDGAETKRLVSQGKLRLINPPESIENNRHKLDFLRSMETAGLAVPGYIAGKDRESSSALAKLVEAGIKKGTVMFPLVGHSLDHKGNPYFCYTQDDVEVAVANMRSKQQKEGQNFYFRSFCPGTEYRIHVLRDEAIFGQVKQLGEDPLTACADALMEKIKKKASKEDRRLSVKDGEFRWMAQQMAGELLNSASRLQRSVKMGWSYNPIELDDVPGAAVELAMNAMEAARLDMGAISIVVDNKVLRVTGIQTAPALTEDQIGLYAVAVRAFAGAEVAKSAGGKAAASAVPAKKGGKAGTELLNRVMRRLSDGVDQADAEKVLEILGD